MATTWMDEVFEGAPVPPWLRRFETEPIAALDELLLGISPLGHLATAEPEQLLLDWLEALNDRGGFRRRLDEAAATWIEQSWGNPLLGPAPGSAARTALAWCRFADFVAAAPGLDRAGAALAAQVVGKRHFLGALTEGASRDPLGRAWLALARHQGDRSLVEEWWRLCRLPPNEPWHRGAYGIDGLRGLPSESAHDAGGFPYHVARGLVVLGSALAQRADERWLRQDVARDELLRMARTTMAAYPMPEAWAGFWEKALQRPEGETVGTWLTELARRSDTPKENRGAWAAMSPRAEEAVAIARQLEQRGPDFVGAIERAKGLLHHQESFAERTGDAYYVVRSACNFAGKVRHREPELALSWLALGRRFDPWNAYTWNEEVAVLLTLKRAGEAVRVALQAVARFPDNPAAYTGLAEALRALGRLDEAEAQYRLTIQRFPENEVAASGLAETLREQGRLDEAEAQYRSNVERFPEDYVAACGLAATLREQGRLDEAEAQYRRNTQRFPEDAFTANGLAETLREQGKLDEAEAQYRSNIQRFPKNAFARSALINVRKPIKVTTTGARAPHPPSPELANNVRAPNRFAPSTHLTSNEVEILLTDAGLLRLWARQVGFGSARIPGEMRDRARDLLRALAAADGYDHRAAGERGLLALAEGEVEQAVVLLRAAVRRFPGSARVRYALARAERRQAEVEARRLDPAKPEALVTPWKQLERIDPLYRPVCLLGAGRAWLVQVDGQTVEEGARGAFGQLGFLLHRHLQTEGEAGRDETPEALRGHFAPTRKDFSSWWAREVQIHLFGAAVVKRADDIEAMGPVRERIATYGPALDALEESYVDRHAAAT